jgi:hypothetical protein
MHPQCRNRTRPQVHEVGQLITQYYQLPNNGVGGMCHAVLDDYNIEDSIVRSTLEDCEREGDELGARIMRMMLGMTRTQRLKVLRYACSTQA